MTGQQTAAEEKAAALQASLAGVEAALAATREELASKQERLSLLEGELWHSPCLSCCCCFTSCMGSSS